MRWKGNSTALLFGTDQSVSCPDRRTTISCRSPRTAHKRTLHRRAGQRPDGYRLDGPALPHKAGADIVSDGIALGAMQVPGDGRMIVLMADRQPTGGYTKIGTVIRADLPRLAQMRPGETLRFSAVTVPEAVAACGPWRRHRRPASLHHGPWARGSTFTPCSPVITPAVWSTR